MGKLPNRWRRRGRVFSLATVFLWLAGAPAKAQIPGLTREGVFNAEFRPWARGPAVRFVDGKYSERDEEGGLWAWLEQYEFGDLNGDGIGDAAAVLVWEGGGSGTFYELVALLNDLGRPRHVATIDIGDGSRDGNNGDRVVVHDLRIREGTIEVDARIHTSSDGLCCPSLDVVSRYRLEDELRLVLLDRDPWKAPVVQTLKWGLFGSPLLSTADSLYVVATKRAVPDHALDEAYAIPVGVQVVFGVTADAVVMTAHHRCSPYEYTLSQRPNLPTADLILTRRLRFPEPDPDPACDVPVVPEDGDGPGSS